MSFHLPAFETNLFFCNKIWQAWRFYRLALDEETETARPQLEKLNNLSVIDHWILSCLAKVITNLDKDFNDARLDSCFLALQHFMRAQLCDVYIVSILKEPFNIRLGSTGLCLVCTNIRKDILVTMDILVEFSMLSGHSMRSVVRRTKDILVEFSVLEWM